MSEEQAGAKLMDDDAAIAELSGLSRNAQLYLMDRIGNNLHAIRRLKD